VEDIGNMEEKLKEMGREPSGLRYRESYNEKSTRDRKCMVEGTTAGERESIGMYG